MTEQEKATSQLTHVGLDLIEGVVSLIGLRDADLGPLSLLPPPGLQELLSPIRGYTARSPDWFMRAQSVLGRIHPPQLLSSERSAAFYRSAPVDGTFSMADLARARSADQPVSPTVPEKNPTLVLPGRLQTKPQEGRADRQRKPTAWAQFLAPYRRATKGATLLSTSFHGRTREIALAWTRVIRSPPRATCICVPRMLPKIDSPPSP